MISPTIKFASAIFQYSHSTDKYEKAASFMGFQTFASDTFSSRVSLSRTPNEAFEENVSNRTFFTETFPQKRRIGGARKTGFLPYPVEKK